MTDRATRYTFHGDKARPCPDAFVPVGGEAHKLIRDRDENGEIVPNRWVCPLELDAERAAAQREREAREEAERLAAERRATAAQIANDVLRPLDLGDGVRPTPDNLARAVRSGWLGGEELAALITAAALAGLTKAAA